MSGWTSYEGRIVSLPADNIDTDQLIPARFMSRPRAEGYGDLLLFDVRRTTNGELDANFTLNRCPEAGIIVTGRNFGSGSSREAAVYALLDAGIRVVISTSFGDIFTSNAVNNGLLPAIVDNTDHQFLTSQAEHPETRASVDLTTCTISVGTTKLGFHLDSTLCTKLMNGWDDIDLTMNYASHIAAYRDQRRRDMPWSIPSADDN